jgi:hypothetical protein
MFCVAPHSQAFTKLKVYRGTAAGQALGRTADAWAAVVLRPPPVVTVRLILKLGKVLFRTICIMQDA